MVAQYPFIGVRAFAVTRTHIAVRTRFDDDEHIRIAGVFHPSDQDENPTQRDTSRAGNWGS